MSDPSVFRSLSRIESALSTGREPEGVHPEPKDGSGLTIFIPTWNHRPYLPRAIRGALDAVERLEEKGFPAEILVIDDVSRDGSRKLLRSVQDVYGERLKTLFLERNLGSARLRNLALRASRFRYLCMLDADNEIIPENVSLFLHAIMETGATLVHGNLIAVEDGEATHIKNGERASMRISESSHIDTFALVDVEKMRRAGGYDPWFYSMEDWEMVLHLIAEEEEIVFVPAVLGYYYIHPTSKFRQAKPHLGPLKEHLQRTYFPTGSRSWDPERVGRAYHPDVGWMDTL